MQATVRPHHRRRWAGWLLAAAVLAHAGLARADARTEARKHFKAGMDLIARGAYDTGVAELERAQELLPHPNVLFNIARARAEQGELAAAVEAYQRYLATGPADADEVKQVVGQLQRRIERRNAALAAARQTGGAEGSGAAGASGAAAGAAAGASGAPSGRSGQTGAGPAVPGTGPEGVNGPGAGSAAGTVPGEGATGPAARGEDVFAEQVVTASRQAQSPLDAPSSTSIITAQDIRLSGLTRIQDLLRRLAGVDVAIMTGGDTEVSIRGYNSRLSNKMLVLIDYRSVYIDLLASTFWETLPIDVEQIERIEVVRGPGSALYGANAFAGVINIITKRPGEGGTSVRAGAGSRGAIFGSATVSQRQGDTAYRLSAGYTREAAWSREAGPGRTDVVRFPGLDGTTNATNTRLAMQAARRLGRTTELTVGGDYVDSTRVLQAKGPYNEYATDGFFANAFANLTSDHLNIRTFYTHIDVTAGRSHDYVGQSLDLSRARTSIFDTFAEYVGQFTTGPVAHDLHVGANYRHKQVDWSYLDRERRENWIGAFAQDTLRIGPRVQAVASLRADYVPFLERVVPAPRGSLIVRPTMQSAVRLSGSTAFRAPSFLESYLDLKVVAPTASGAAIWSTSQRVDSPGTRLKEERVLSFDLGYLSQDLDFVNVEVTGYYLRVSNVIDLSDTRPETPGSSSLNGLFPSAGRYSVGFGGWENKCGVYSTLGSEVGARFFPLEGLDLFANYTLNMQRFDRPDGCATIENRQTPQHKVNVGAQVRSEARVDGELTFHYVGAHTWVEEQAATDGTVRLEARQFDIDAYTLLNGRVGYRLPGNQAEVSVTGFNLLNQQHRQHPFGQRIGQRFMAFFSYRF